MKITEAILQCDSKMHSKLGHILIYSSDIQVYLRGAVPLVAPFFMSQSARDVKL